MFSLITSDVYCPALAGQHTYACCSFLLTRRAPAAHSLMRRVRKLTDGKKRTRAIEVLHEDWDPFSLVADMLDAEDV